MRGDLQSVVGKRRAKGKIITIIVINNHTDTPSMMHALKKFKFGRDSSRQLAWEGHGIIEIEIEGSQVLRDMKIKAKKWKMKMKRPKSSVEKQVDIP